MSGAARRRTPIKSSRESLGAKMGKKGRKTSYVPPSNARRDSLAMEDPSAFFDNDDDDDDDGASSEVSSQASSAGRGSEDDSFAREHGVPGGDDDDDDDDDNDAGGFDAGGADDDDVVVADFGDDDAGEVDAEASTDEEVRTSTRRGRSASATPKKKEPTPKKKAAAAASSSSAASAKKKGGKGGNKAWERRKTFGKIKDEMLVGEDDDGDDGAGARRSKRSTMRPLQYWKGEKVVYQRDYTALPVVKEVILRSPSPEKKTSARRGPRKAAAKRPAAPAAAEPEVKRPKWLGFEEKNIPIEERTAKATVWTGVVEDEGVSLAVGNKGYSWHTLTKDGVESRRIKPSEKYSGSKVAQAFDAETFSTGILSIPPGVSTPEQDPLGEISTFYVVRGYPQVHVFKDKFSLGPGSTFYVPAYNCYKIKNLSAKQEVLLAYTTLKEPVDAEDE